MKYNLLITQKTIQFILSLLTTWKSPFFKKKDQTLIPVFREDAVILNLSESIRMYCNVRSILKMHAITGWNYNQSLKLNKSSFTEPLKVNFNNWGTKIVLPISLFLLVASNVYAAPPNYTVVGVDKFNGADGAGNSISQNATALGGSFNAIIRNGSTNDFTFDCGSMTTNWEDQPKGAIIFRYTNASSFYAVTYHRDLFGTGNYMVRLKLNTLNSPISATGDLGSYTIPGGGGVTALKVTAVGSSIQIWINGTLRINVTNSALPSGSYGFGVGPRFNDDSVIWNNVVWTAACRTVGTASSSPSPCINTAMTTITHATTGVTAISSSTGLPAGVTPSYASNTISISGTPTASGTFNYTITPNGCGSATATGTITVSPPSVGGTIAGSAGVCTGTNSTALTLSGHTGSITKWQSSTSSTFASAVSDITNTTTTLTASNLTVTTYYRAVIKSGACAIANSSTATVTVSPATPAQPGTISGTAAQCPALTAQTYSITAVTNATSYNWTVPTGWTITTGAGTTSITITTGAAGQNGNVSVRSQNPCGNSSYRTLAVTVNATNTAGTASSNPTVCINTALTNITRTTTGATGVANAGTAGANGLPAGVAASWNSNTITIFGTPSAAGIFNYIIPLTGGCGSVNATGTIIVSPATPAQPGSIIGLTSFCNGQTGNTFSISPVTNASTYNWTAPAGWTLTAGSGTNAATYTAGSVSGNISVSAQNACGTSAVRNLAVTVLSDMVANAASISPTICSDVSIGSITHTTLRATGIANNAVSGANGLPAGVSASWASNNISISGISTVPGTYNYSIPLTGGCGTANATGTIIISPSNSVGVASSTPTICINTALTNITHTTTGATGIANAGTAGANGLPTGVAASWNSNTITIFGTPSAAGIFNYSIPLQGGCGAVNATGTITVSAASVGGSASGSASVCTGTNSTTLTLSGFTGSITKWQSSTSSTFASAVTDIANTTTTLTASNLTATTYYRAVITNGACAAANSSTATITVSPASVGGTVAGGTSVCSGANSTVLTLSGHTGSITRWESSLDNFATAGSVIANTTTTLTATNLTANTSYRAVLTSGSCAAANSATATVTISPNNTVGLPSSTPTVCINTALTNITHTTTGATGILNAGTIGANGLPAGVAASWNTGIITIFGTPSVSGTYGYSIPLIGGCGSVNATGTITVSPANTVGHSSALGTDAQTVCNNTAIGTIQYTFNGLSGITGANVTGLPSGINGVYNAGPKAFNITGSTTQTGTFNYTVTSTGGVCSAISASGTITISPTTVAGTVAGSSTVCTGSNSTTLTLSGQTGNVIKWQSSPVGSFSSGVFDISNTTTTLTASNLTTTTFYRAVVLSGACASQNSIAASVTVSQVSVGGSISGSTTVCTGTNSTLLTLIGHTGAITRWESSLDNFATAGTNIANTNTTFAPSNLTATTYYRAVITSSPCAAVNSATATITVTPTNTVTLSSAVGTNSQTRCINSAITNITYASTTATGATFSGLPAGVNGNWASNVATISGTPTASGPFTYIVTLTGGCGSVNISGTISVTPASVGGSVAGSTSRCAGTNSTTLTLSGHTGAITRWESSLDNFATAGTSISNTTTTLTATNLTATTYYRAVITNGVCAAANSATASITVNPKPVIASKTATICSGQAFSVTPVNGTDIVPVGTTYTWTVVANANVTGEANQAIAQTGISQIITNTTNTVQSVVYTVTPTSPTGPCAGATFTVTVSVNPSAVIANKTETICSGSTFSVLPTNGGAEIVPTGSVYSWTVVDNANLSGEASGTDLSAISGTLNNLTNSNQTLVYTVVPTSGLCDGVSFTVTVTVTPTSVGGTVAGGATVCTGTNSTTLTLSGHTGVITKWQSSTSPTFASAVTDIANTTTSLTASNLTVTTYYRAVITSGVCAAVNSASATVTVSPASVGGTIAGSATVCTVTNSTVLTLSGHTGAITRWESSLNNFSTAGTAIANTTTILTASNLTATTYYRTVITSGACAAVNSATAIVTVTPNNTSTLSSAAGTNAQTKCINTAITNITYATTTATGATFSGLPAGINGNWAANVATISGTPTASGTFNYTVTLTGGCGAVTATGSIIVNGLPSVTLGSNLSICSGVTTGSFTYSSPTNGADQYSIAWTAAGTTAGLSNVGLTTLSGGTISLTGLTATAGNYPMVLTIRNSTTGCSTNIGNTVCGTANEAGSITLTTPTGVFNTIDFASYGNPNGACGSFTLGTCHAINSLSIVSTAALGNSSFTIAADNAIFGDPCGGTAKRLYVQAYSGIKLIVIPTSVGGTIAGSTSKCAGTNSSTITLSGHTGSIVKWQSSSSSTFASAVTDIANTATTYTATNLSVTTYYRAVVQSGVCSSVNSAIATITITQAGSGNFSYASYGFCTSTTTAQAISTSNFTGVAGTFSSAAGLSIVGASGNILPSASTAGAYVVTYTIPATGGCAAYTTTTNVTIDGAGTGTITYSPSTICTGTAGTVSPIITGAGGSGSSTWFTAAPTSINMDASGVITPSTSAAGSYTITYNRSSTGLCAAYSTTTSVTINASPTITSSTPGSRCGTGSVVLGGVSSSGTVNWYAALTGGSSLASGNTFNTPSISVNTTYYADAVSVNGCVAGARTAVLATVNTVPTVATTTPASRCGTGTITLGATASAGAINWYAASTGGASLGTGTSFTTPSISSTTNYYAEAINGVCPSSARTLVVATINAIPTIASTTPASNCGTGSVTLGATSTGTLNWYVALTGGASLATGTSYTTPIISTSTTYYVAATANGCSSTPRTAVIAGIATSPSISSFINGSRCNTGTVNLSATPSSGATIKWYSAATGGSLLATGNTFTTPSLSTTTTYYAEATAGTCIQPSRTAVTATINATPVVAITADYCTVPGNVVLTANAGMSSYTWSNGGNTQSINVDQAGTYNVFIVSPGGCSAIGSLSVATELVTNGSFSAGNTGFTTAYTYVVDGAGQGEMYPEGTYAIVSNPNSVHDQFYGQDRNSPTGKIMVINGSPTLLSVWNQNNIAVLPNTTYYFSGWGMSVVNGQNAILQFSINGSQVGTIAYLPNGYTNTAGPYTWVRFYGQWESGPVTSANLSIVNLNTIAGGNDFALDDISFGTMAPVALSANPVISGNAVCQNEPLVLTAGALGGASPFTYSWTGPNGFTSTLENPLVTSTASSTQNGTYTVEVTDGFGCTSTQNIAITVSSAPTNIVISAAASAVCSGGSTSIELPSSEIGVYYQLRNNATNSSIGALVQGTGAALSLPTGVLTATTTFNVLATRYPANCDVQMSNTATVNLSVTPEIAITNQAACSGTVNLTSAGVTAGSTGSGTLSYWTTLAATTAVTTPTAVGSGTYYIKSTNGSCFDIEPVVVSISATPSAAFTFASASYCTTGADPIATVTGTAGVFTATPAGLVFVNTNNGEIDLSASTPGTYTVKNTVTPIGACSPVSVTRSVIITAAPLAGFNYVSNDLCQSANALNASPIFDAGASAGTFSTSAGLSLNTTSGVINVSASTPGNYAIVNTRGASGGCPSFSDTTFLDINPYIFAGSVSSSSTDDVICLNETIDLYSNATSYATVLLRERFNGSINNWTTSNTSTGGTPVSAAWTLRQSIYNYSGNNYSSNDASQFYMSNAQAQGSGTTTTILRSPVMSTIGFSSLSMDFFHYFNFQTAGDIAKVQISTNNTTWTDLGSFTSDQGSRTGFVNASYNLNAYVGLPTVYIRFNYLASSGRSWNIDNVSVTGNSINYGYAWSTSPVGFTSALQNPTAVAPLVNSFYTVTATNSYGCSTPTSPIPVTVNPLPADNAGLDQNICGSGSVTLGAAATAGNTYAWTPTATLSSASVAQPIASPVANTTYTLTETITATGCSINNDVDVTVTPLPTILSTAPAGRCGTGTLTLSAVSSTGSMKWYANLTGGVALGTANSFTTPSISANTTYYVEATSASCVATSRVAVIATINAAPSISSQATAAASYSQNITAVTLSVVATAGSGTITGYQWYSNTSASTVGASQLTGATSASYVPSTAIVGTLYYYCVVTNSNGCTVNSAFSGAIITLLTPAVTSVTGTTPLISGQATATGYRGQSVTINGSNFISTSTVTINGVAATVTFVNSTQLRAVVNNSGVNSAGNMVITNPTTGAFVNTSFNYIGYLTSGSSVEWSAPAAWLGGSTPTIGSNATLAHANTCNSAVTASMNEVIVLATASLTFGSAASSLTTTDLINDGTISWTNSGTLTIGNTIVFSGSAAFNAINGTVVFNKAGDQVLFSGLSDVEFYNVTLAGSGNKSLMTNTEMTTNNLIVSAGTTFDLTATDSEIDINGNLTLNGDINPGTSEFKFTGTVNQSISLAGAGTILFNAMRVDKPSGLLLLNDDIQVQESLTMVQGNINTQGFLLEIGKDLTQRGTIAYTSGMIQGKLRRWYSSSTNTGNASGLFPMGQDVSGSWKNRNVLLEYSVAPTTGGHLTVEFMAIPMINGALGTQDFITSANTGGAGFQVSNFSNDGYWKIDNLSSTLIDGAYTIALSGEGFSLPNGLNEVTIVKRVGGGDWFCPGTHLAPTGTAGLPILHRSGVSGFSNFGFAGGPSNPLPITLVNFDGICDGSKVNLSWTTASESNNKMFVIEVSSDAKTWSTVETVLGAGNSNTIRNYTLAVNSSYSNGSYYRLTQIDYNGDSETFDPIYVNCDKQESNVLSIFPNPAYEVSNLDIKATEDMEIQLTVFSSTGQILMSQKTALKKGNNIITLDIANLSPGMYHVNIVNDKKIEFSGSRSIIKR